MDCIERTFFIKNTRDTNKLSVSNFQRIDGYVVSSKTVREWVKDAAEYHGIPHLLLAVILQQENGPSATELQKILQFSERIITNMANVWDEILLDFIPDKISRGSTGISNMSSATLKNTAIYTQKTYGRHPVPSGEQQRAFGDTTLPDLPGLDWKHDLYYAAAHIRQLIHQVTNQVCHSGILTKEQMIEVFSLYNGKGNAAAKYGNDAMLKITKALNQEDSLFFYEK